MRTNESERSKVGEPRSKKCVDVNRTTIPSIIAPRQFNNHAPPLFSKHPFVAFNHLEEKEKPRRIVDRQTRDLILRFYVLSPFAFILSFGLSTIIVPFERHLRLSLLHTATFPIIAISIKYSYRINDLFDKKYTRNYQVPFDRSFIKKDIGDRFGDYLSELFIVIGLDSLGRCVVESRESKWKNERMREFAFARKRALFTEEKLERLERYSYNRCTRLNPVPLHSTRS